MISRFFILIKYSIKKSLNIPKRLLKAINRRRTDNTMAKRKKEDKRKNNDLQNITQIRKERATRTPLKRWGELR